GGGDISGRWRGEGEFHGRVNGVREAGACEVVIDCFVVGVSMQTVSYIPRGIAGKELVQSVLQALSDRIVLDRAKNIEDEPAALFHNPTYFLKGANPIGHRRDAEVTG